ncbi:MAG: long-chain fatty acid--CoA ligase [Microbacterium sp. SCN 70-200]|uniref:long-chain-fatty-acid--CoA ligase n=1 Tax=unclassified Microbacterium TaxID=2609290 RepID=UPI0008683E99|nr:MULTISPECIES: long-chain-fatty-acid--CoA ligase [unclassified Microbacterium]MBN9215934.1 AMP-binding protein [Microbacterium sp.]ODT41869.1 MAG: long-chain fatty acid--CoA ligase [Microbacterium sp. SCN 70-200]OJV84558.1 MAG: long-chain fatty acid--CoA ligase [Microbacterium sp. 70-16]
MNPLAARPWLSSYADGVPADIEPVTQTLVDMLAEAVARYPQRPALEFFGAVTTYRELADEVGRVAGALHRMGVRAGDRVALIMPNAPQHVVAFYAAQRLGAIVVEHNPRYTAPELRHLFEVHHAKVAIVWDAMADTIAEFPSDIRPDRIVAVTLPDAMPRRMRLLLRLPVRAAREKRAALTLRPRAKGVTPWATLVKARRVSASVLAPTLDDIAVLQFTSGTTGRPKAAVLTHRNLRSNAAQSAAWVPDLQLGSEVFYGVLPLFHAYGLTLCMTTAISVGARIVLFPTFDVGMTLDAIRRTPPTFLPAVPPIYDALARATARAGIDLSSLRNAISGAMALPAATVLRWEEATGGILVEGYGMTESSPISIGNPMGPRRRTGTVGVPFPSTEIRVVDPDDPTVDRALGEPGELLVRGPQVFQGYWNQPEETARTLLAGGWLRTGDIVTADADGFVTVVDRLKELIITGGFNISPSEVEDALLLDPDIVDAAVVGIPRADGGEAVAAAVVMREGAVFEPERIRETARAHLAAYKVPRSITRFDELPRSMVGKVLRREVRDELVRRRQKGTT